MNEGHVHRLHATLTSGIHENSKLQSRTLHELFLRSQRALRAHLALVHDAAPTVE